MNDQLRVSMESPQSGWMCVGLKAGSRQFVAVVSHAPEDSLRELMKALVFVLSGGAAARVSWNAEPEEYAFEFGARGGGGVSGDRENASGEENDAACDEGGAPGDEVELRVVRYAGRRKQGDEGRVVFEWRGTRLGACVPFWRELAQLGERGETDAFEQNWRRAFPRRELEELTRAVEARGGARETHEGAS